MKAKDLAKKLGVSPATISLVLNNKPGISESLRRSLLEKIEDLGCRDMICESCKNGNAPSSSQEDSCPVIAYLIYTSCDEEDANYAFYPAVLEGAEMEARDISHCLSVLHMNREGRVGLQALLRRVGNVVGVIIQAAQLTDRIQRDVESLTVPFVFVDFYRPDLHYSGVCVNNEQGIFSLVKHLMDKGHRKIGYVYSENTGQSLQERRRCFHEALRYYGLEDTAENLFTSPWDPQRGSYNYQRLVEQLRQTKELPTALVAEDDADAIQIMLALREMGLRVPEDVSVTGFDNSVLATMAVPQLTSVKNYRHMMGRECVSLLQNLRHLRDVGVKHPCLKYEIATKLVERNSVKDLTQKEQEPDQEKEGNSFPS